MATNYLYDSLRAHCLGICSERHKFLKQARLGNIFWPRDYNVRTPGRGLEERLILEFCGSQKTVQSGLGQAWDFKDMERCHKLGDLYVWNRIRAGFVRE